MVVHSVCNNGSTQSTATDCIQHIILPWIEPFTAKSLTLRGRAREELVSKTSQFKLSPASSVTDL